MSAKTTRTSLKQPLADLKVAIVHDWLIGGGAERVVLELHRMFPDAPIYTSYATREWRVKLDGKVKTGTLQHWPFSKLRKFIAPLRIWWFQRLRFKGYDLVISSSGAEAKSIKVPPGTLHVNYCHAPTHYYWSRYDQYMKHPGFGPLNPLARAGLRLLVRPLRRWDYAAAQRPDYMIANSVHIKQEIGKYYGRAVDVIHPPVDVERFKFKANPDRYGFVIAARQVPYKRVDLAVAACTQLKAPLKVIGRRGPEYNRLTNMAGPSVRFLTSVRDEEMAGHFQGAAGFIFPGVDDFGIVAVEAMAAGTPVIAYKAGGATEFVVPGKSGVFFEEQTVESLTKALRAFKPSTFDNKSVAKHASKYAAKEFSKKLERLLLKYLVDYRALQ